MLSAAQDEQAVLFRYFMPDLQQRLMSVILGSVDGLLTEAAVSHSRHGCHLMNRMVI